jgi:hypothetical protein
MAVAAGIKVGRSIYLRAVLCDDLCTALRDGVTLIRASTNPPSSPCAAYQVPVMRWLPFSIVACTSTWA